MAAQSSPRHCALCEREAQLSYHHLIPRKVHRRPRFRKHYLRDSLNAGIYLCSACHRAVHRFHDQMTLALILNTLDALKADPAIRRHVDWVRKRRIRAD